MFAEIMNFEHCSLLMIHPRDNALYQVVTKVMPKIFRPHRRADDKDKYEEPDKLKRLQDDLADEECPVEYRLPNDIGVVRLVLLD